jgi:hypothetical protein
VGGKKLFGWNNPLYKRKLVKIPSVATLAHVVIYYDVMLHVSASFGHHQVHLNTNIAGGKYL